MVCPEWKRQERMKLAQRTKAVWRLRTRTLELGARTLVMGVVNITPDSFSDGGRFLTPGAAIAHGLTLLDEGANVLDLGAESTRPGARVGSQVSSQAGGDEPAVSAGEEQARLMPALEGILSARPDAIISVDTYKASTARAALEAGAEIVNDVSGFTWDAGLADVCAEFGAGVVIMHTRGRPEEWSKQPQIAGDALVAMVRDGLAESMKTAARAGVALESVVLDAGYGFGKRLEENYTLLARQAELLALGRPLLAGLSRKSFLAHTLAGIQEASAVSREKVSMPSENVSLDARENASLAAMTAAILNGASIVRVHTVRAAVEAARIADAILYG